MNLSLSQDRNGCGAKIYGDAYDFPEDAEMQKKSNYLYFAGGSDSTFIAETVEIYNIY